MRWAELFGRDAPLIVELGFGGGHFLVGLGQQRPECNVIGVEISAPSLSRASRKIKEAGLENTRILHGEARLTLQALCEPGSVSELYINFPDPWPKPSHHRRRLITPVFLRLAASRLHERGKLEIATDHPAYAAEIAGCLAGIPTLESQQQLPYVTEDCWRLRTKYERNALQEGRQCYYFKWQRNGIPAPDPFPIPEEMPMPHVVLRSPLSLSEIGRRFEPVQFSSTGIQVKLLELFQSSYDQKLLVEAYINEDPLKQRLGISVRKRTSGELVVSLNEMGFPRVTAGVHLAIGKLATWITGLHPESEIVTSNVNTGSGNERGTPDPGNGHG
jgi:tRNA (guanine-N7-)-methyltransferase